MRRITFFIFSCLLVPHTLLAGNGYTDNEELNDTIRLDEVIVTGSMPKVNLRNVPMSISIVGEQQIRNRLEPSLLPILTEEVPGLFITQRGVIGYGVANGAAGGMSIRGIGGMPTSGVLVLIDGHPQYMGLMGHPLADSYQSMMAERVEVVRGPASVLYGSNAMGGVINIITKKQQQEGLQQSAQTMYGSHNTFSGEVMNGWRKERLQLVGNIGYNRSDGHRENMEYRQVNAYGKAGYQLSGNWSGFIDLNLSNTKSSNPGSISNLMIDNDADILRGVASAVLENEFTHTSGALKFFYNFGRHEINDGISSLSSSLPPDYRFRSNDQMFGFSVSQSYSFFEGNKTTAGLDFQRFGGKAWNKFNDKVNNEELADVHLNNQAGYVNVQQTLLDKSLTINTGIRLDHHEINGSEWIPQFGISFTPSSPTVIKAIVSKGFRNPAIREMYMFPPKNPGLRPEQLWNYELSYLQTLLGNRFNIGVNLFYINGDNMIRVEPGIGKWSNTGKVENKGFEISSIYMVTNHLRLSSNYSYLYMRHKIIAAPEHKLYVSGIYTKNRLNFSTGMQYIGNLYKAVRPEHIKENFLLWNARAGFKASEWLNIFLKGENLLDQKYEINAGYPMPGATVSGGLQVQFKYI
nr:TonB-dependent receptor [Proteiniphilum sp. UBA5218]